MSYPFEHFCRNLKKDYEEQTGFKPYKNRKPTNDYFKWALMHFYVDEYKINKIKTILGGE